MSSALYPGIAAALTDALSVAGQKFTWNGQQYDCILNADNGTLITSKALFAPHAYPSEGHVIRIASARYQVIKVANATSEFMPGGMVGTSGPFVDDPNNPALSIGFEQLING